MSKRATAPLAIPSGPGRSGPWRLGRNEVHVWIYSLATPPRTTRFFEQILSRDEKDRAETYGTPLLRRRFVAGRGGLRAILAAYLRIMPDEARFCYGPAGKPALADEFAASGLNFNLAHSGNLAAVAVTRDRPVGIDIEQIKPLNDAEQIVARFFSAAVRASFQKLPRGQRMAAFYNLWTRQEAWLKAAGQGMAEGFNDMETSFIPGEPPRLIRAPPTSLGTVKDWSLRNIALPRGYAGTVAVRARGVRLTCRRFNSWPAPGNIAGSWSGRA